MEKEGLVHYVPAGMMGRLKKLLVRLWETRNPASASLGAILSDCEQEIKSLNETILDVSRKECSSALREKEKSWALEREKLQQETALRLEEGRASAAAQAEQIKAAFFREKAELNENLKKAQRNMSGLAAENRLLNEGLAEKDAELGRRLFEAKSEYERDNGRRVQEAVEEKTGRLLEALKSAEKKSGEAEAAAAEAARAKEESGRFNAELAERARQAERLHARQAEELAAKEQRLASLSGKVKDLEKQISDLDNGRNVELADKLRVQEAELARQAAERLEYERAIWEAQSKRRESLLAKAIEDVRVAKKEIESLAAENRLMADELAEKDGELERRLFEAKSEYERESGRRLQKAVEAKTSGLLEALKSAETKNEGAAAEAARAKDESCRLKTELSERTRQFEERRVWQAEELTAKEQSLASALGRVKALEKQIVELNNGHNSELADKLRGQEAELTRQAEERLEYERAVWEAQSRRQESLLTKTIEDFKNAQREIETLEAESRRMADELAEKDGELERRLFEAKSEYERESGRRLQKEVEGKTGLLLEALKSAEAKNWEAAAEAARAKEESGRLTDELAERERRSGERSARQAEEFAVKEQCLAAAYGKVKELEKRIVELNDGHYTELLEKLRGKELAFNTRLEEFEKEKSELLRAITELKARFESEKGGWEAERERIKAESEEKCAESEAGLEASLRELTAELERDYAARREVLAGELRAKEAELNREALERIASDRAIREAQGRSQGSLLGKAGEDLKRAQKEIENLTAENRRISGSLAEKERESYLKEEAQLNEALARERERLMSDYAGKRAALEDEARKQLAVFEEKERNWSVEKARYESELALIAVSTRSFMAERVQKMKADFAKRREELEEEYEERIAAESESLTLERDRLSEEVKRLKPEYSGLVKKVAELETELFRTRQEGHEELSRLAERIRVKDALLISEKERLNRDYLEKYAAMEAGFESLKADYELKNDRLRQSERKAAADKEALEREFNAAKAAHIKRAGKIRSDA